MDGRMNEWSSSFKASQSALSIQSGDILLRDQDGGEVVHHASDEDLSHPVSEEKEVNRLYMVIMERCTSIKLVCV